jgi:hypothetical protein
MPKRKKSREFIGVHIEPELKKRLLDETSKDRRTVSSLLRLLIDHYLKSREG